jgi:hypothetical protein
MKRHLYLLIDTVDEWPVSARTLIESWLAFGHARSYEAIFEPSLVQDFGMDTQAYAALSWLGEGNDPGASCWMYADPVHFALQRDHFSLAHPAPLVLSAQERATLLADINRHFEPEGLQFCCGGSGQWFLRVAHAPEISTSLLRAAAGHDVRMFQPQGPEAPYWKRLQNELQMLLHEHPVNQAREARGELSVNSLWISGQGRLPETPGTQRYTDVYASHTLALGLGKCAGLQTRALDALDMTPCAQGQQALVVMDGRDADLAKRVNATHAALRAGTLGRLRITVVLRGRVVVAELGRFDLWKRWHRPKPLQSY